MVIVVCSAGKVTCLKIASAAGAVDAGCLDQRLRYVLKSARKRTIESRRTARQATKTGAQRCSCRRASP